MLDGRAGSKRAVLLDADGNGLVVVVEPSGDVVVIVGWASGDGLNDKRLCSTVCEGGPSDDIAPADVDGPPMGIWDTTVFILTPGGGAIPGGICSAVGRTLKRRLNFVCAEGVLVTEDWPSLSL